MNQPLHQTLHYELLKLRSRAKAWLEGEQDEEFAPYVGICDNLVLEEPGLDFLHELMEAWPDGTGKGSFPVPHPVKKPCVAYLGARAEEMWDLGYEYARNRWALLEWLIEQTTTNN